MKKICLSFVIHFSMLKFVWIVLHSAHVILIGVLCTKFLKITSKSGKIPLEFLDIAHGRSWQNFTKSEQQKLRGKLDSANFNFRLLALSF